MSQLLTSVLLSGFHGFGYPSQRLITQDVDAITILVRLARVT